jgi:hypothetical protein
MRNARLFAVVASLALVLSLVVTATAPAIQSGQLVAGTAKKGCKKGKKGAAASKKSKCKKKKKHTVTVPITPTLRATLTWPTAANLDLYAYAPDGTSGSAAFGNPIPSSQFSADDTNGNGPETFTDLLAPTRQFSYAICDEADNGAAGTVVSFSARRADGTTLLGTNTANQLDSTHDAIGFSSTNAALGLTGSFPITLAPATC